ncbi:hypothetical protein HPB48_017117 [Haemaphysalis longicornis]|uniref:Uncharacterized protein n=1 Tax=Haemaphysalis longicornis TaxID=44386 RepID=A0A9J6FM82_HAELO|nr:hypothetical protein HPB48_017117 [Haemaphysalis longicornis]
MADSDAPATNQDGDFSNVLQGKLSTEDGGSEITDVAKVKGDVAEATELEYNDNFSVDQAYALRQSLTESRFLRKLKFSRTPLRVIKVAFENLHEDTSLEELELFCIDSGGQGFSLNLPGIFRKLRSLRVHSTYTGDSFAKEVAVFLRGNDSLQDLSLWLNDISDEGAVAIAEALAANTTLKTLNLLDNNLTSKTVVAFADMVTVNSTLKLAELFEVDLELKDIHALFEQDRYAHVFERIYILWKQEFLPYLTKLLLEDRHCSDVAVDVTSSVPKYVLRNFFNAVAQNKTVRMLHFYPSGDTFDVLIDGLVHVVKVTKTLTHVENLMTVDRSESLVRVLNALKSNHSVTTFSMYAYLLTPDIAQALSELLLVNSTLTDVAVCEYRWITSEDLSVILKGLRENFTLTGLIVSGHLEDDVEGVTEMEQLLKRNARVLEKAAEFVVRDGQFSDDDKDGYHEGAESLKKVFSSAGLLEVLEKRTGKNRETLRSDVERMHSSVLKSFVQA